MQNKIRYERTEQVLVAPRIQQRHIQDEDIDPLFLGKKSPLLLYFLIVASKTINACNAQLVAWFQKRKKRLVLRALKIFA